MPNEQDAFQSDLKRQRTRSLARALNFLLKTMRSHGVRRDLTHPKKPNGALFAGKVRAVTPVSELRFV